MIPSTIPAGTPIPDLGPRPAARKRWLPPRLRGRPSPSSRLPAEPAFDHDLPAWASVVESRLLKTYCHSPGSYCCWPKDGTAVAEAEVPPATLKRYIALGKSRPTILVLRGRKFDDWLETVGSPVYGLRRPPRMGKPPRVIVFLRRLPSPRRDPDGLHPLGLECEPDPSKWRESAPFEGARVRLSKARECAFPSSMEHSGNGTEENRTLTLTDLSTPKTPDPIASPGPSHGPPAAPHVPPPPSGPRFALDAATATPAASTPIGGMDAKEEASALAMLAKPWKSFRVAAYWRLADAGKLPAEWVAIDPPGPRPPDVSGPTAADRRRAACPPAVRKPSRLEVLEGAIRALDPARCPEEDVIDRVDRATELAVDLLSDHQSPDFHHANFLGVALGFLKASDLVQAARSAMGPDVRRPAAIYAPLVTRLPGYGAWKNPATGLPPSVPAAGPHN